MSPLSTDQDPRAKARQRKRLAIEEALDTQGRMQILWIRLLRRNGFNFVFAYYIATTLSWLWYAMQRLEIEVLGA